MLSPKLLVTAAILLTAALWISHPSPCAADEPTIALEIQALHYVFGPGSWELEVSSGGSGTLTVAGEKEPRQFQVASARLASLARELESMGFFALDRPEYGVMYADGPCRSLSIRLGSRHKKVVIHALDSPAYAPGYEEVNDLKDVLRIWAAVRALFKDDIAIDRRESDSETIDRLTAVDGATPGPPD